VVTLLPDPAVVSVAGLMALEPVATRSAAKSASLAERPGTTATPRRGQGHEIREIRPFADGDDPRHIDAAATARIGSPQVRSFHEDRERSVMLIADFRRPMLWGTQGRLRSVAAADALALAGWKASLEGGAVGLVALTDIGPEMQPPRPRHRGMALVAGALARAHATALADAQHNRRDGAAARALAPDLLRAARETPRGAAIVLASALDTPGEGLDAALAVLAARGPLRIILIEDAFEVSPPHRALPFKGPEGTAFADFTGLAAARAARAAALARPGLQVHRLPSSGRIA
jgi:uncharacterized protein (DUF58 family)